MHVSTMKLAAVYLMVAAVAALLGPASASRTLRQLGIAGKGAPNKSILQ